MFAPANIDFKRYGRGRRAQSTAIPLGSRHVSIAFVNSAGDAARKTLERTAGIKSDPLAQRPRELEPEPQPKHRLTDYEVSVLRSLA
jgi:hypothetical protein